MKQIFYKEKKERKMSNLDYYSAKNVDNRLDKFKEKEMNFY